MDVGFAQARFLRIDIDMPINIAVAGQSPVTFTEEQVSLGSAGTCTVRFDESCGVKSVHATIREIAGRWLLEAAGSETFTVGKGKACRVHWLEPGDLIHLTAGSPVVTFQPPAVAATTAVDVTTATAVDMATPVVVVAAAKAPAVPAGDDFLPVVPRFVDSPPSKGFFEDNDVPLSLQDDAPRPAIKPATKPTSSPSVPVKSSTKAPVKSPPSASATSSSGISLDFLDDEDATEKPSHASVSRSSKKPRSKSQIPAGRPEEELETAEELPVLQRMSSWDDLEPAPRRGGGRTSEQEELQWIMSVVGRALGGGAVILVVWLTISSLYKAFNQPGNGVPALSSGVEQNSVDRTTNSSQTAVASTSPPVAPRPTAKPNEPNAATSRPSSVQEPDEGGGMSDPSDPDNTGPAEPGDAMEGDENLDPADPDESIAEGDSSKGEPTEAIQVTKDSLFLVIMQNETGTQRIQVGTAWAASPQHLVTSAAVATVINSLQKKGMNPVAVQFPQDETLAIKKIRIHPAYPKYAVESNNKNEKRAAVARAGQLRYNLAVLDIDFSQPRENFLAFANRPLKTTRETTYTMVGFPFLNLGTKPPKTWEAVPLKETPSRRLAATVASQPRDHVLTIKFSPNTIEQDWSGSPVLNKENQVIGVYAQLPQSKSGEAKRATPDYAVVWIGLLREFATDVLHSSTIDNDR